MLIEVGAIFLTITRTSTAGSRIFKGARQIWDFEISRLVAALIVPGRFSSLFRFGKLRRVPTHQLSSKQRAKSTPLKLIAAPDWKEINSNLSSVFEDPTARRWGSKKSLTCSFPVCYLIVSLGMMPVKSHRRWWWSLVDVGGLQCGSLHTRSLWRGGVFQFQKTEDDGNNFRFLSK